MTMKKLLGISLALVMLMGSTPLGFSEPLKIQLEQGIDIDQIQCNNDSHVLVIRTNGNYACVFERTADKMNWEIIINNNESSVLKIDLSDIPVKSNVLEGDYQLGLWTKSIEGSLVRMPPPMTFSNEYSYIVTQDGNIDSTKMNVLKQNTLVANLQSNIQQPSDYLKYFPTYIPDGQELKFFTFEGSELGASIVLIYAPIPISINPQELTMRELDDIGGIKIIIIQHQDYAENKDGFVPTAKARGFIIDTDSYPPHTVIHSLIRDDISGGMVTWDNDSALHFKFESMSYPVPELLKMAENALQEN